MKKTTTTHSGMAKLVAQRFAWPFSG